MGKCVNHPDRETSFICMKHEVYMCDECAHCRDPEIYCKFRSSCPIWFMHKEKKRLERKQEELAAIKTCKVVFMPDNKETVVPAGSNLLEAALAADVPLNASCNGKGSCGKCKLVLEAGNIKTVPSSMLNEREKSKNYVLACQSTIHGDVRVKIPEETLEKKLKIAGMGKDATDRLQGLVKEISPMLMEIPLELKPPTLEDSVSDLDRLKRGLKKSGVCDTDRLNVNLRVMRDLANVMRDDNWNVTAFVMKKKCSEEVMRVEAGNGKSKSLGIAVDIGTTSVVVYLTDMADGSILAAASGHNRQAACGDDVINRIVCAEKDGVKKLGNMVLATINGLINEALDSAEADYRQIRNVVLSGNTTMTHLLLKIDPRYIRREPYIPTVSEFPILKGGAIGLKVNPFAGVFVMPGPASYVGGDIVSGLLYTGFHRKEPLTMFIDVGTNGEIVLGNKDWLMTASCSAGPAFEGGGVRWGMRAEEGAIEKISIDPDSFEANFSTVGDALPRGICGSGMIDLISEMLLNGIIDQSGKFATDADHPRIKREKDEAAYIVAFADKTAMEQDIVFTESDIDNIIRSKGAVYAGFTVLLNQTGLDFSMVEQVVITGGFGQFLDMDKAITIGLLPDIDRSKFKYLGNSSIAGAYMALLSENFRREAIQVSNNMTYIDFSSNNQFMDEFTSALFLPHTNVDKFPSVKIHRS
ncbi:ASKHA domain-containing protein [Desulfobacterales bacterium HSG16]|nr:ASKHA domain-containing protein [Desulfobacterales bacterium HSG16]